MKNVLITGGAGFIGSNLVASFLADPRIQKGRVLDNLSNSYIEKAKNLLGYKPLVDFIEGLEKVVD